MSEKDDKIKAIFERENQIAKFFEELGLVFETVSKWSKENIKMLPTQTRIVEAREVILLIWQKLEVLLN